MRNNLKKLKLQFSEDIKFPDKCVYCGKIEPDGTIPLSPPEDENGNNGRMLVYAVPACSSCAYAQIDQERQVATLAFTLFLVIFTGVMSWVLRDHQVLFYIAISVFLITAFASIHILKGLKLSVTITSVNTSTILFCCNNEKYCDEFSKLNVDLIIKDSEGAV